jgi:hypothetical protein
MSVLKSNQFAETGYYNAAELNIPGNDFGNALLAGLMHHFNSSKKLKDKQFQIVGLEIKRAYISELNHEITYAEFRFQHPDGSETFEAVIPGTQTVLVTDYRKTLEGMPAIAEQEALIEVAL